MLFRFWFPSACLIFALGIDNSNFGAQIPAPDNQILYVGELFTKKFAIDPSHQESIQLVAPKVDPPGSTLIHFEIDPADKNQIILQVVPLKPVRLKVERFGYFYRNSIQKFFQPINLEAREWPVEPAKRAIRAGAGNLKLSLQTPPTKASAGTPVVITLQANGPASLAIESTPVVEITTSSNDPTNTIRLQSVSSRIDWPNTIREWTYEWIPQSHGNFPVKPLIFSHLGPHHQIKTQLVTAPPIQVLPRPLFTQPETTQPKSVKTQKGPQKTIGLLLVSGTILLCAILAGGPFIRRQILRHRLRRALCPNHSFEETLAIYRKIKQNKYLSKYSSDPASRVLLDSLEKKLFGRS